MSAQVEAEVLPEQRKQKLVRLYPEQVVLGEHNGVKWSLMRPYYDGTNDFWVFGVLVDVHYHKKSLLGVVGDRATEAGLRLVFGDTLKLKGVQLKRFCEAYNTLREVERATMLFRQGGYNHLQSFEMSYRDALHNLEMHRHLMFTVIPLAIDEMYQALEQSALCDKVGLPDSQAEAVYV